ncbi:MAG TPA: alpha/beta fold hydrolase, partial [Polyangiales bacterium]
MISAHDVVFEHSGRRILRFKRSSPALYQEPVLFCFALVNRPYVLDLLPGKSVVERYLECGFDVYLLDWGVPRLADRTHTLDHYVEVLLRQAIDHVLSAHRCARLHLLGYCMGGTMCTIFTALHPSLIKTLTLLASPIDFAGDSLLNVWTQPRYFDVEALLDAHGNCPGLMLQGSFLLMKPVQNLLEKYLSLYENLRDREYVGTFRAIERWTNDNIPVAGAVFRDFIEKLYRDNQLVRGTLHVGAGPVSLHRITCPLLLLTADADHLVPSESTNRLRDHVGSRDVCAMS